MAQLDVFNEFKKTAYRIEMQPTYDIDIEQANFKAFCNGEELDPDDNKEWITSIKKWVAEGKQIERVRVVSRNLSLYEKYEFRCYHKNVNAGENVRVISREKYNEIVPQHLQNDFWVFDGKFVAKLIYDSKGRFIHLEIVENPEIVNEYTNIYQIVKDESHFDYKEIVKQMNLADIEISFG